MEHNIRSVSPQELIEDLLALLEQTEPVPLVISGNSMAPFLIHGRDTVFLANVKAPLKRGDMVLYRRLGGQYILHRICQVREDSFCMVGDGQCQIEPGIRKEQILATVCAVRRNGKLLEPGSLVWAFYEKVWIRIIRLRPRLLRLMKK